MSALLLPFDSNGHWQAMAKQENELSLALQQRNAEVTGSVDDVLTTSKSILSLLRSKLSASDGTADLLDLLVEELAIIVSVAKDALSSTATHLQHERSILTSGYSCILGVAAQRCVAQQQEMQMLQIAASSQRSSAEEGARKLSNALMQSGLLRLELEETKKKLAQVMEERDAYARQRDDAKLKCLQYIQQLNQLGNFALKVKEGLNTLKKGSAVE
jgi:hypothetical protein